MNKLKFVAIIISMFYFGITYGQDNKINERLDKVEEKTNEIDNISSRVERMEKLEDVLLKEIELSRKELKQDYSLVFWIGVPITLLALIGFYFSIQKLRKDLESSIAKKIEGDIVESLIQKKEAELAEIFLKQEFENRAKSEKVILVISDTKASKDNFSKLIHLLGFKSSNHKIVTSYEKLTDADLIIFNQFRNAELITKYLEDDLPQPFIGYYPNHDSPLFKDKRFSLVNLDYTLYSRIIELFKFKEFSGISE